MTVDIDAYRTLLDDVGAVRIERDVVRVSGRDAVSFLQGQLSQDVVALDEGASAWSWLLQPQGKVDALVRVTRTGPEELLVDVDGGWGEAVLARLQRFRLRVKADLQPLAWRCVALRGPRSGAVDARGVRADASWGGLRGVDLLGEDVDVPDGVPELDAAALEVLRIEAGMPRMGRELTERTIPAETGAVDRTVSFTKGCYTGQELVARIDSRGGHVPRHLRGVVLEGGLPPLGAKLLAGGAEVGSLTSVAESPARGPVALAYVKRDVSPPAAAEVVWDGAPGEGGARAAARIEALPLLA